MPTFTWDVDPALHLGPVDVPIYSLFFFAVFYVGHALVKWQILRAGGREKDADHMLWFGLAAVILGSRLGHVLWYDLDRAIADPMFVLRFRDGGMASHGGTIGMLATGWWIARRRGLSAFEGWDTLTFPSAIGATFVRIGNLWNSEIVGRLTDQTWGVRFPRHDPPPVPLRHPSQIYEIVLGLLVLAGLYWTDRRVGGPKRPRGLLFFQFLATYFGGRFLVEYVKEYQVVEAGSALTMGQWLSVPFVLAGVVGIAWSLKKNVPSGSWGDGEEAASDQRAEEEPPKKRKRRRRKKKARRKSG